MTLRAADSVVDATAALLTPRGRGAVATVRVCGLIEAVAVALDRHFHAVNRRSIRDQNVSRICFGHWQDDSDADAAMSHEDVVVCRVSESEIEVHCHGGDAAVNRILGQLEAAGVATQTWQQQRAVLTSPFEVECRDALSRATTVRAAAILLEQCSGLLEEDIAELRELSHPNASTPVLEELSRRIRALVRWSTFGRHLSTSWRVVLAGRPNVGKSTLINGLLGYGRAIVFDQPGTTRDVVTGNTALDGWPVLLADTAGIRDATDGLEREGIERTRRAVADADLVCLLLDASQPETPEDRKLLDEFQSDGEQRCIVVMNKSDLPRVWMPTPAVTSVEVSSLSGKGLDELMHQIVQRLVPDVPPPRTPVPVTPRQIHWLNDALERLATGDIGGVRKSLQCCLDGTE